MKNIVCSLFGHKLSILGHTEPLDGIIIHYQCNSCYALSEEFFKDNDPYIDEEQHPRGIRGWSGYSWWMHKPMERK